ncbi:MAG: DNA adenine methylase, partial [Candidatus Aureabacteria bacterium]|nr:DNA adenine methylase [Candidatus Auribacterota bacterium]
MMLPQRRRLPKHKIPFRRIGSKSYIAPWIVSYLPEHYCYIEVCGGTGAVLWCKGQSSYEVFNDIDSEIYSFFKALREHSEELISYLQLCPVSRQLVKEWGSLNPEELPLVERAARFFMLSMLSFSGTQTPTFPVRNGYRKDGSIRKVGF